MKIFKSVVFTSAALVLTACQNPEPDDLNEPTGVDDGTAATWQLANNDVMAESSSLEIVVIKVACWQSPSTNGWIPGTLVPVWNAELGWVGRVAVFSFCPWKTQVPDSPFPASRVYR